MTWLPTPSLRSTICLCVILAGFALVSCAAFEADQNTRMVKHLVQAGDTAGALLISTGNPIGILAGGLLIATGHAASGIYNHNRRDLPRRPRKRKERPHALPGRPDRPR